MTDRRLEQLKIVFAPECISAEAVFDRVIEVLQRLFPEPQFSVHGRATTLATLKKKVLQKPSWPSGVQCNGLELRFAVLGGLHDYLLIAEHVPGAAGPWPLWVEAFMQHPGFVQAWVVDQEYDYWQNAKDPLQYDAVGKDHSHLAKRSNGLPFPLEQLEIDVSDNPGRWALREGYVEAVAAQMWLGDRFWKCTGEARKDQVLQAPALTTQVLDGGVISLVAAAGSFVDSSTAQIQQQLRAFLYPA